MKTIVEFLDIPQVTISSNDLLLGLISTLQPVIQAAEQTVQKVAAFIRRRQLFACGEHILVAVSGGSDSMALLSILQTLAPLSDYHLSVAHVNHLLRPEASGDAEFVRHYCQMNNLPFYDSRINVAHWVCISHQSIETATLPYPYDTRFSADEDRGVFQHGSGNRDSLAFSTRQICCYIEHALHTTFNLNRTYSGLNKFRNVFYHTKIA